MRIKWHLSFDARTAERVEKARGREGRSAFVERVLTEHFEARERFKAPTPQAVTAAKFFGVQR